ncbi:MAG: branched-chain amino acid transport system II carrier protein [Clostridium sp.]
MKQTLSGKKLVLIGFTLFSMFFGAGNLIFPPFLAAQAGTSVWAAMAGFLISAVGLPILGVVAVAHSGGLTKLAGRVHPIFALVFTILIYLSIGPCLAIPRTASTSFEMAVLPFLGEGKTALAQFLYSAAFFAIATFLACNPDKLTERLGKILCPTLLVLIFAVFVGSVLKPVGTFADPMGNYMGMAPVQGFLDGYQTMDTIAALNFGIIIALNIQALGVKEDSKIVKTTIQSGILAGILLGVVYIALAFVGAQAGSDAQGLDNGARILTFVVSKIYGKAGVFLLGVIFFIACLNTCTGLICCCSKYFSTLVPKLSYGKWMAIFVITSFIVSNAGLSRILAFSVPVLNAIYPIAIVLIILSFMNNGTGRLKNMYPGAILLTGMVSVVYALEQTHIVIPGVTNLFAMIPGYTLGLGWLIPAAIGCVAGCLIGKNRNKSR